MIEGIIQFARHYLIADIPPLSPTVRGKSALGSLLGLFLSGLLLLTFPAGGLTLIAPMGATAIILFTLSHSPLAQPWPVLGGYLVATISALLATAVTDHFLAAAVLAVGAAAWLMLRLRCMHPPGGALALFIVTNGNHTLGAALELTGVVVANVLALLLAAWAINNLLLGQRYPQCRPEAPTSLHNTADQNPTERAGLTHEDLEQAIQGLDTFVDIQEGDLVRIYNHAVNNAFERHMAVTCGDVMARDTVSVQFGTELEEAWNLLRKHKIKALPVVDSFQRIIGIVTVADFLRQLDDTTAAGLAVRLQGLLRRTPGINSEKAEVVGQIMSTAVYTASTATPVAELVHQLSDLGMHHIPVVDSERKLVGMVTQSDLIAALYRKVALASV